MTYKIQCLTDFALQNLDHPDQLRQYLDTIKTSSNHLLQLINDILDMSRIESGKMEIEAEPFNAAEQFDQVISIIEPLCRKRSQTFIRRFEIMRIYSGNITAEKVTYLKPRSFDNDTKLLKVKMTGKQLKDALNDPLGTDGKTADCVYAFSGLKGTYAP